MAALRPTGSSTGVTQEPQAFESGKYAGIATLAIGILSVLGATTVAIITHGNCMGFNWAVLGAGAGLAVLGAGGLIVHRQNQKKEEREKIEDDFAETNSAYLRDLRRAFQSTTAIFTSLGEGAISDEGQHYLETPAIPKNLFVIMTRDSISYYHDAEQFKVAQYNLALGKE